MRFEGLHLKDPHSELVGSTMQTRAGEVTKGWFRSDRFYHTPEGWWFQTRENTAEGPFFSQRDADRELCLYIRRLNCYHGLLDVKDGITDLDKITF